MNKIRLTGLACAIIFVVFMFTFFKMEQPKDVQERERQEQIVAESEKRGDYVNVDQLVFSDLFKKTPYYVDDETIQIDKGENITIDFDAKYSGGTLTNFSDVGIEIDDQDVLTSYGSLGNGVRGDSSNTAYLSLDIWVDPQRTEDFNLTFTTTGQLAYGETEKTVRVIIKDKTAPSTTPLEAEDEKKIINHEIPKSLADYDLNDADELNELIEDALVGVEPSRQEDVIQDVYDEYMNERELNE